MKRHLALPLAACALLSACGPATKLDLQLRAVPVNVLRVVTPAVTLVPPSTTPPVSLPPLPPITAVLPSAPSAPAAQPTLPPVPPVACPTAGQFDVPEKTASPVVVGYPAAHEYVQSSFGSYVDSGTVKPLTGVVDVKVVRLPSSTAVSGQRVDAWRVERRMGKATWVEAYQLVHASPTASAISPGIYLAGLAWDDPTRGKLTFQPAELGLEILPDPVAVANNDTQYAGTATDPDTLTTMALVRNVRARKRVDACGKLIDTYSVEMTAALVSPDAQYTVNWTQQLATAYGGLDVESTFALSWPVSGFSWSQTLRSTTVPAASR